MKKNSTALIGALTLTAIILSVILLVGHDRPVQAGMLDATSGYSLMAAGVTGSDDSLVVIDKNAQKMVVYKLVNGTKLNVMAGYDLASK